MKGAENTGAFPHAWMASYRCAGAGVEANFELQPFVWPVANLEVVRLGHQLQGHFGYLSTVLITVSLWKSAGNLHQGKEIKQPTSQTGSRQQHAPTM